MVSQKYNFEERKNIKDIFANKEGYKNTNRLKYRLIKEGYKEHKCEICGLTEWQNQPIPIVLDHIDGDCTNNARNNLRIVCANCDAQLPTFKSKNKHSKRER